MIRIFALFVGLIGSLAVHAGPITWTLSDVIFEDGGSASGSFTYDADGVAYTNVSITTSGFSDGTTTFGGTYTQVLPSFSFDRYLVVAPTGVSGDLTGVLTIGFEWAQLLSNDGLTTEIVASVFSIESVCTNSTCLNFDTSDRRIASGRVSTQVPVPATLALIGVGLAGLGWKRR